MFDETGDPSTKRVYLTVLFCFCLLGIVCLGVFSLSKILYNYVCATNGVLDNQRCVSCAKICLSKYCKNCGILQPRVHSCKVCSGCGYPWYFGSKYCSECGSTRYSFKTDFRY